MPEPAERKLHKCYSGCRGETIPGAIPGKRGGVMKTKRCKVKKIKDSTTNKDRTGLRDFDVQDMLGKDNLDSFLGIPGKIIQKRARKKAMPDITRLDITLSTASLQRMKRQLDSATVEITITFKPGAMPKWIRS